MDDATRKSQFRWKGAEAARRVGDVLKSAKLHENWVTSYEDWEVNVLICRHKTAAIHPSIYLVGASELDS